MKKILFFALTIAAIGLFTACEKEASDEISDAILVEEISTSTDKTNIEPSELPTEAIENIEENYFDSYIDLIAKVEDKGYEIILGNEDVIYTNLDGKELVTEETRSERGRAHRVGPCGRGRIIPADSLSTDIIDYINTNFPDDTIRRAKVNPFFTFVLLTGRQLLVFNRDGSFVGASRFFHHCRDAARPIRIAAIPPLAKRYITANYPDAEIKVAYKKRNGNVIVGILDGDTRRILVFDADGNFLMERP